MIKTKVIKKDGTLQEWNPKKIHNAVKKACDRCMVDFIENDFREVITRVENTIGSEENIEVGKLHNIVESVLQSYNLDVAKTYMEYRNYKIDFVGMLDEVYNKAQKIMYLGDKDNANTDSTLVTTQRSLIYNELNKELYNKFFLNSEERQACRDGYIYIHDKSARRDTINCCLFDSKTVMTNGFEMGNMWYNEPNSIDTACDVLGDIIMMSASMQYGGWSSRVDDLLAPYVEKSYNKYKKELITILTDNNCDIDGDYVHMKALDSARRDLEQGIQGLEYKLNSVASSRGDYPFVTFAIGLDRSIFGKMVSETVLKVRREGQGKDGFKKPVLFPKIVFLYDEKLHGKGRELEDLFDNAILCSSKAMYPDYLSLTGKGYVPSIYKEYGEVIYPMGCRAFLSPYYRKGGINKLDDSDIPYYTSRFNIGAITLNLIMIYQKSRVENRDFYEVLDYYLNMIRRLHIRTYDFLGEKKASTNPLAYCEGGLGGFLKPNDKIKPLLKSATASFGVTGLNELQIIHNSKTLVEDGKFAIEVMQYINDKVNEFKNEDGNLYAIYGTPAESLCGLQVEQFRSKYGEYKGITDKEYTSNSFHCYVGEDITPVQKQDLEERFWDLFNGGKIQYVRYPLQYNHESMKTLIRRAMDLGFYEGVNMALSHCEDCGHDEIDMDSCSVCGSYNLTKIDRMNGYLSYSRVKGDTRLNKSKMAEIKDRVSM